MFIGSGMWCLAAEAAAAAACSAAADLCLWCEAGLVSTGWSPC